MNKQEATCSKCLQQWPPSDFTMYERDQKPTCNGCCRIIQYHALWAKDKAIATKLCKGCGSDKPLDEYYSHPGTADRKQPKCKICMKGKSNE